jgi:hypothetical protein
MLVILATQEAEIRRIMVQKQPRQIVLKIYLENTHHKNRAGGVAQGQGIGPEFKSPVPKKSTIPLIIPSSKIITRYRSDRTYTEYIC